MQEEGGFYIYVKLFPEKELKFSFIIEGNSWKYKDRSNIPAAVFSFGIKEMNFLPIFYGPEKRENGEEEPRSREKGSLERWKNQEKRGGKGEKAVVLRQSI